MAVSSEDEEVYDELFEKMINDADEFEEVKERLHIAISSDYSGFVKNLKDSEEFRDMSWGEFIYELAKRASGHEADLFNEFRKLHGIIENFPLREMNGDRQLLLLTMLEDMINTYILTKYHPDLAMVLPYPTIFVRLNETVEDEELLLSLIQELHDNIADYYNRYRITLHVSRSEVDKTAFWRHFGRDI